MKQKGYIIGYTQYGTPITNISIRNKLERKAKEKEKSREKYIKKVKERFEKAPEKLVGVIGKALHMKPKKFLLKRERATIRLPTKKVKPILRKSEIFENEYEKEKALLGWK